MAKKILHFPGISKAPSQSDMENSSLVLKIAMQHVSKPPVWREVQVPGTFNFYQLHFVIQAVYYLFNCHLWSFGRCAYDQDLSIGMPDDAEWNDNYTTHQADETPLMLFLGKKGDKLVYTYDFGDSWEFAITVSQVKNEKIEFPLLLKWKGDLQPVEDSGGVWCYMQMRNFLENESTLTQKQKNEIAQQLLYEDAEELKEVLEDQIIDPEDIILELKNMV